MTWEMREPKPTHLGKEKKEKGNLGTTVSVY